MKKLLLLMALLLAAASPSLAYEFKVDGLWYRCSGDNTVGVASYSNLSGALEIPESVIYNGTTYTVTSIDDYAFNGCDGLTSVTIPNSVTYIGHYAFSFCRGLTSVTIPNSVTSISEGAFRDCSLLTSVSIPNSVTYIGHYAFYSSGLTSVTIPNSVTSIGGYAFKYCSGLTSVTIPNSVTSIGEGAFSECSGLTSITIPNSVTSIGRDAFCNCSDLTRVNWNATSCNDFVLEYYDYKYIGHPFSNCESLNTVVIGDNVETLPANFMRECDGLTSVTIPNSVTTIGDEAFYYCSGLTSITIPNSITKIGESTFESCSGLTSITIPNSVTSIGDEAFFGCSGLTSITIPSSVTSIGKYALCCGNLLYAKFEGDELPSYTSESFYNSTVLFVKTWQLASTDLRLSYKVAFKRKDDGGGTSVNFIINFIIPVNVLHESGEYVDLTSVKCNGKEYTADGASSITLTQLFPNSDYPITLKWARNGKAEEVNSEIRTGSLFIYPKMKKVSPTAFIYEIRWDKENEYLGEPCILVGSTISGRKGVITGLIPDCKYYYKLGVANTDGDSYEIYYEQDEGWQNFTTPKVSFSEQKAIMTKDTKVMLVTATNLADVETNCGFEWRRYDAPDEMPSTQVPCPVFGGNMAGILEGLSKDVYYKFRPYVKYSNGEASYGEWVAFITADAGVKFSPMVYTYDDARSDDAGVMLSGVVIEGSDPVAEQGFEYWENYGAPATAKAERGDHLRVAASGERMTATISNNELVNGATYSYRSYAIVAGEEFYGDVKTFVADHGGIDGVEGISIDSRNADDPDALIDVYNINGQMVRTAVKRGEAVKGLLPGFYIVGGRKVLVK